MKPQATTILAPSFEASQNREVKQLFCLISPHKPQALLHTTSPQGHQCSLKRHFDQHPKARLAWPHCNLACSQLRQPVQVGISETRPAESEGLEMQEKYP